MQIIATELRASSGDTPWFRQPDSITAKRRALFREALPKKLSRWLLGAVWAIKPPRHKQLPALAALWLEDLIDAPAGLPDPQNDRGDGLAGMVHDLSVETLTAASVKGLYPFAHVGPLKWWSPPQRALVRFRDFKVAKRMRPYIRNGRYKVAFDQDFEEVIAACARPRGRSLHVTWITPRMMWAYAAAYDAGLVHCFSVRNENGELVGGGYGVSIGAVFVIESQFSQEPSASKVGFITLMHHLQKWGYAFVDNKRMTPTIEAFGFTSVPRAEFMTMMDEAVKRPGREGRWTMEASPADVADWNPAQATQ